MMELQIEKIKIMNLVDYKIRTHRKYKAGGHAQCREKKTNEKTLH